MTTLKRTAREKRTSLFKKTVLSTVSLIVCVFFVAAVVLGIVISRSTENIMLTSLNETAVAYNKLVQKDMEILETQISGISEYAASFNEPFNSVHVNEMLDQARKEYGFTTIYGLNAKGDTHLPDVNAFERDYFKAAIAGKFYISSPFLKSDGTVGITAAYPAYRNGAIDGIVSIGLPFDYFCDFINFKIGKTGSAYIVDRNGTMVASQNASLVQEFYNPIENAKEDPSLKPFADSVQKILQGERSILKYNAGKGQKQIIMGQDLTGTDGWLLITTMNQSEITGNVMMILGILALIVVIGVLVGIAAAVVLARSISRPIVQISNRMHLLAQGDLKSPVPDIKTGDESQILAASVQDTIEQVGHYIYEISDVSNRLASGDLKSQINGEFRGDFEPIKSALNNFILKLNNSFSEINEASDQVYSGSEQVASGAQSLSQGATEQAASVEELSSVIAEMAAQIKQNAENTGLAKAKSELTREHINLGNSKMSEMSTAMEDINKKSGEINKIIKTIEDIAFQTNILALNAAVEAARAGDAGKGFAVVADEVRDLASKSAQAAKSTTALIDETVAAVSQGTSIASATVETIQMVVSETQEVTELVEYIAQATEEQAQSISQVSIGIDQISAVVQNNSATSEESAAASEELSGQAQMLKELVDNFKLRN